MRADSASINKLPSNLLAQCYNKPSRRGAWRRSGTLLIRAAAEAEHVTNMYAFCSNIAAQDRISKRKTSIGFLAHCKTVQKSLSLYLYVLEYYSGI